MNHYKEAIHYFTLEQAVNERDLTAYNFEQIKEKTLKRLKALDDRIKELKDNGELLPVERKRLPKEVKRKDPPTDADGSID